VKQKATFRDKVKHIKKERSVICREDDAGGQVRVTRDKERVPHGS